MKVLYAIQQKIRLSDPEMEYDMDSPLENHAFEWETNLYIVCRKSAKIEIEQNDEKKSKVIEK